jgi:hypothetical protein
MKTIFTQSLKSSFFKLTFFLVLSSSVQAQTVQIHQVDFESALDSWTLTGTNTARNGGNAYKNGSKLQIAFNASTATSPVISTLGFDKVDVELFVRSNDASTNYTLTVQYRETAVAAWQTIRVVTKGDGSNFRDINFNGSYHYITATIFSTTHVFSATSQFRLITSNNSSFREFYVDYITVFGTTYKTPASSPGGISAGLDTWLRADKIDGSTLQANNTNVNTWIDFGKGNNAKVSDETNINVARPQYRNNPAENVNFNPVVSFANNTATAPKENTYLRANRQFLYATGGFHTNDFFAVVIPDTPISSGTNPPMDVFTSQRASSNTYDEDITGFGFGNFSARYDGEVVGFALGTNPTPVPSDINLRGYGIAEVSGNTYSTVGIINPRNKTSGTSQELYLNGLNIGNTEVGVPQFSNENNRRYWLGRSQVFDGSFNGRIAEVITYSSRKNDASERIRIQSYLAVKYGITLGVNGISQNYQDSNGNVIWDASANAGFNFDIAGIGQDDASLLNQKESKSQNNGSNPPVMTIGLGDIFPTNDANPNNFLTDRSFLMWGTNGQNMNKSGVPIALAFGPDVVTTLTDISNRKWKLTEIGGNVPTVKVSVPTAALTNFTPLVGNDAYVMVVADDAAFTTGIETVFLSTNGLNQEALFDFDGTKYIAFGVAHETVVPRHMTFDGNDDFIRMDSSNDLTGAFTVMAWVRTTGSNSTNSNKTIVSKFNGTTGYILSLDNNNRPRMDWNNGSGNSIVANTQIPVNKWHHVAVIYNGTAAAIYIDGVLDRTQNLSAPIATTHNFSIGSEFRSQADIRNIFRGDIDEVRFWDRAVTIPELQFIMNQEIEQLGAGTRGKILPTTVTKNDISALAWTNLTAYYSMNSYIGTHINDDSQNNHRGRLIVPNRIAIITQTAPLPYLSNSAGSWENNATWVNGADMDVPHSLSIIDNTTPIGWNIVQTAHNIDSNGNKTVLGMFVNSNKISALNDSKIEVSHYLKLDGKIDLEGRSQLVQTLNSDLDPTSSGILERDQQGTVDIFKYNYWSSPVGIPNSTTNNNTYTLNGVLRDGTNPANPLNINWIPGLDGAPTTPISISTFWLFKFENSGNNIANWIHIGETGNVDAGKGYISKGSGAGSALQNYTFTGKPNNGLIQSSLSGGLITLFGNPFPSALDSRQFIIDNLSATDGVVYFWEHWGGGTHNLLDYQGGYAVSNLVGSVPALSHPDVNQTGSGTKLPGRYIPVGQGFFLLADADGGTVTFNNNQRAFVKEDSPSSNELVRANKPKDVFVELSVSPIVNNEDFQSQVENFTKIRLSYVTQEGFRRHTLLAFTDGNATDRFDKGFDALNIDEQANDMYFVLDDKKLAIQGVGQFDTKSSYPIGVAIDNPGEVRFILDNDENLDAAVPVYIYDKAKDTLYNLKNQDAKIYIEEAGTYNDRFSLRFSDKKQGKEHHDKERKKIKLIYDSSTKSIVITNESDNLKLEKLVLYNLFGRKLETFKLNRLGSGEVSIQLSKRYRRGVYVVHLHTSEGVVVKKLVIS